MNARHSPLFASALVLAVCFVVNVQTPASGGVGGPKSQELRVGDPAPSLTGAEWVREAPSSTDAPITVLIFWASWCPLSREVFSAEESFRRSLSGRVRFIAVSYEPAEVVRTRVAGFASNDLGLVADPNHRLLDAFVEASWMRETLRAIPSAVILGPAGIGGEIPQARVLWMGRLADREAEAPLAAFEATVLEIVEGRYDLDAAIVRDRLDERLAEISAVLATEWQHPDTSVAFPLLAELRTLIAPGKRDFPLYNSLNGLAWNLATREGRTAREVRVALQAVEMCFELGGESMPMVIDTHARVLREMGRLVEAIQRQENAVQLVNELDPSQAASYVAALVQYRREAGLPEDPARPPDSEPESATPSTGPPAAGPWRGTLNDAALFAQRSRGIWVQPAEPRGSAEDSSWTGEMGNLIRRFGIDASVVRSDEFTNEDRAKPLVLYGSPSRNAITAEILDRAGIVLEDAGVRIAGVLLPARSPVLITALPNPWNPAVPARIYTSFDAAESHALNRFFHGDTSVLVGQQVGEERVTRWTVNYATTRSDSIVQMALAPERVSRTQAIEDLRFLAKELESQYAGYPELDRICRSNRSSWAERTQSFEARLASREVWLWLDLFEVFREYLSPVRDAHFGMRGAAASGDSCHSVTAGFIRSLAAYFVTGRVHEESRGYVFEDSSGVEHDLTDIGDVGSPFTVEPGRACLFPTLGDASGPHDRVFLLGTLEYEDAPPSSIEVSVREGVATRHLRIPVHRGESGRWTAGGRSWTLEKSHTACPILRVRTMNPTSLQGLAATADSLRQSPGFVLDLRDNGGGSDGPGFEWSTRLSGQVFRLPAGFAKWPGADEPFRRFVSYLGSTIGPMGTRELGFEVLPYEGRVFVLINKGVCSSGETLTMLASQLPRAVLVGENTAGMVSYGNVVRHGPLPHSGIELHFGQTGFAPDYLRPVAEGVGLFPDYWLDDANPVPELQLRVP